MRYHTKEYYRLWMSLDVVGEYEPVIDKEVYTEEDIEELYQQAMDEYIEEERAEYDAPPVHFFEMDEEDTEEFDPESYTFIVPGLFDDSEDEDKFTPRHPADIEELTMLNDRMYAMAAEAYENRPPFDEEESRSDFEEMYRDNLDEPDEELPEWVREAVDPRILAMYRMPEKIYRKLASEDEENEERFDALDDAADEALESMRESLPEEYQNFMEIFEDLEDSCVVDFSISEDQIEIILVGWNDSGNEEVRLLRFSSPKLIEEEGIIVNAWEDEDGESDSDCEFLYGEIYIEDGMPEVHMLFDNNGLKYLTFSCTEAIAFYGWGHIQGYISC